MSSRLRLLLCVLLPFLVLTAACGNGNGNDKAATRSAPKSSPTGACSYTPDGTKPARKVKLPTSTPATNGPGEVTISTNRGDISVRLDADQAPCTVNSFLSLAKQGFYDDTPCHRLTGASSGIYVLQCGDPSGTGTKGPGYSIPDELVPNDPRVRPCHNQQGRKLCTYGAGTIAMANQNYPHTGGSQFFLVYRNSPLPPTYTVFGHMDAAGLKVVQAVAKHGIQRPDANMITAPKESVTIKTIK